VKNADRILQGLPGWESIADAPQVKAADGRAAEKVETTKTPAKAPRKQAA
jgi:hypothetical protein